jgi:Tol biopolymer transport system component
LHPNTRSAVLVLCGTLFLSLTVVALFNFMPVQHAESVVFMRQVGEDMDIFTIMSDGTQERQLTDNTAEDWAPVWTLDKSAILFHSNRDGFYGIYRMNPDGSNVQRLTPMNANAMFPMISPDGTQVAFEMYSDEFSQFDIYTMSLDGSNIMRITNAVGHEGGASWSPDGRYLAFHSTMNGYYDIYVLDLYTYNLNRLTYYSETMDVWPTWSPDGSQILFHSERDGNSEIYIMNRDGSNPRNLSNNASLDRTPRFSADGKQIIFRSERTGNSELFIMNSDGTNAHQITNNNERDLYPNW